VYSPVEILAEMRHSPDFLQAEWADLPARQRSVRATFDYSWNLLDENEQGVFQALCVFRGRFTRQAAEVVSCAHPWELRRLMDKSLVMPLAGEWYTIHTLLQQFGLEKLNAQPAVYREVHQRYSAYFLERVIEWEAGIKGARQLETLAELDTKINDLRPAWDWAAENYAIDCLQGAVEGLCLYYELRARFSEGKSLCQETAQKLEHCQEVDVQRLLAHLAAWESRYCRLLGERDLARQRLEYSQSLVGELAGIGLDTQDVQALIHLEAAEQVFMGDLAVEKEHLLHSLGLYRQLGDSWRTAGVLYCLGKNRHHAGDYAESDQLSGEALELYQELGASAGIASARRMIVETQFRLGNFDRALALMERVIAFSQASGDRVQQVLDLHTQGVLLLSHGRYEECLSLVSQALPLVQDLGNRHEIAFVYLLLGLTLQMTGQYELARGNLGKSLELGRNDGFQRETAASLWSLGCIALVEASPVEAQPLFQESLAIYRQIGHQDELSWALSMDAFCYIASGQVELATSRLVEALQIAGLIRGYFSALFALAVGALWLGAQGQAEKALQVYTLAATQPIFANSAWFHQVLDKSIINYTEGLPAASAESARERGRQRQLWPTLAELLLVIKT
jgi:tetratricopeptide (TPR) repeat protein